MSFRTFIRFLALLTALLSSLFWIRSACVIRANDIAVLSQTMWSYNLEVAKNLCHQRADALVAIAFLSLSVILQMFILSWSKRFDDRGFDKSGLIWAIVIIILFAIMGWVISDGLYANQFRQVEAILKVHK